MKEAVLVLGAGNSPRQTIKLGRNTEEAEALGGLFTDNFERVVTIDIDPAASPTFVHDLEHFPWPVQEEAFDEVHAYEVLEHLGGMGDWLTFFFLWRQIWLVLKPGGLVCASTPWWESVWAWQDPGHRRVYSSELLTYLSQEEYKKQIGNTAMTDYRRIWEPPFCFHLIHGSMRGENPKIAGFNFVLQKHYYKEGE